MPSPRRAEIAGIFVDVVTERDVLALARERIATKNPARIVTVNAEFVVRAQADEEFADAIRGADLATPDGAGVVWALRRQGLEQRERVGGSDLIWSLSAQAAAQNQAIFLLGGRDGVAARAAQNLRDRYPGLCVAGTHAGSAARAEEASIVHLIRQSRADILYVAFGAPEQELWIARNLHATGVGVAIGVGGSFDYLAGTARRAPIWMQQRGLEWLWRLMRQPWRWKRMLALPKFVWLTYRTAPGEPTSERISR